MSVCVPLFSRLRWVAYERRYYKIRSREECRVCACVCKQTCTPVCSDVPFMLSGPPWDFHKAKSKAQLQVLKSHRFILCRSCKKFYFIKLHWWNVLLPFDFVSIISRPLWKSTRPIGGVSGSSVRRQLYSLWAVSTETFFLLFPPSLLTALILKSSLGVLLSPSKKLPPKQVTQTLKYLVWSPLALITAAICCRIVLKLMTAMSQESFFTNMLNWSSLITMQSLLQHIAEILNRVTVSWFRDELN